MHEDLSQLLAIIQTVTVLLVLSAIFPAYKLARSSKSSARTSLKIVALLTVAAPLALLAWDRLRTVPAATDARTLQAMPLSVSQLPGLYFMCACAAAIALWLLMALHSRHEA